MSFDSREFFRLADSLASDGNTESEFRTAVNRAYYSVFNRYRERTGLSEGEKEGVHTKVRELAERQFDTRTATKLLGLFRARVDADYYMSKPTTSVGAKQSLAKGRSLLKRLGEDPLAD
ncbi:MAG: hypothetical protein EVA65_12760 [Oceanococcus sp.]|nr:MAG: hypothetical protein EVA65_12760 [Oceanococcus sp.]